jgi:hypothetical protein
MGLQRIKKERGGIPSNLVEILYYFVFLRLLVNNTMTTSPRRAGRVINPGTGGASSVSVSIATSVTVTVTGAEEVGSEVVICVVAGVDLEVIVRGPWVVVVFGVMVRIVVGVVFGVIVNIEIGVVIEVVTGGIVTVRVIPGVGSNVTVAAGCGPTGVIGIWVVWAVKLGMVVDGINVILSGTWVKLVAGVKNVAVCMVWIGVNPVVALGVVVVMEVVAVVSGEVFTFTNKISSSVK